MPPTCVLRPRTPCRSSSNFNNPDRRLPRIHGRPCSSLKEMLQHTSHCPMPYPHSEVKAKERRAVVETRPTYVSATGRPLLLALFLPFLSATRRKPSRSYLLTCEWDQSSTSSITSGHVCHSETNAKAADFHVIAMTIEATILLCGREMKKEHFALLCFASPISSSPIS